VKIHYGRGTLFSVGIAIALYLSITGWKMLAPGHPTIKKNKAAVESIPACNPDQSPQAKAEREAAEAKVLEEIQKNAPVNMAAIPAGEFQMGSVESEEHSEETPRHKVYLDGYYIGKYEVTAAQYKDFANATSRQMREQPGWSTDRHPVVNVNWEDASAYCKWAGGRLPTEAEWEKAARGGAPQAYSFAYSFGNDASKLGEYAWYDNNSNSQAHPVGEKKPNQYGLHDMNGNVWEWVSDWYDGDYYTNSPAKNPNGPDSGGFRCIRGGSWPRGGSSLRAAFRGRTIPSDASDHIGFRCASSLIRAVFITTSTAETEAAQTQSASDWMQRDDLPPVNQTR
jgi:formylglycine-generating enzyme required for sulfatase activity